HAPLQWVRRRSGEPLHGARSPKELLRMSPPRGKRAVPLPWLKPGVLTGSLVPLASIVHRGMRGSLGANPVAEALNELGLMALVFLILSLACTPAKVLFGVTWPIRIRRMLGLLAFFYATLHLLTYVA